MTIIRKVLTLCSLSMAFGFAQEYVVVTDSAAAAQAQHLDARIPRELVGVAHAGPADADPLREAGPEDSHPVAER